MSRAFSARSSSSFFIPYQVYVPAASILSLLCFLVLCSYPWFFFQFCSVQSKYMHQNCSSFHMSVDAVTYLHNQCKNGDMALLEGICSSHCLQPLADFIQLQLPLFCIEIKHCCQLQFCFCQLNMCYISHFPLSCVNICVFKIYQL